MRRGRSKRIWMLLGTGVIICLAITGVLYSQMDFAFYNPEYKGVSAKETFHNEADTSADQKEPQGQIKLYGKKYAYYDRIKTYLFLGTDNSGSEKNGTSDYVGSMADFIALLVVDKTEQSYSLLQLNRDTMTKIRLIMENGKGEATARQQLCTAHWYGGNITDSDENTVEAVEKLLGGIEIDGYYTLNMEYIPRLNHAIGGVEVTIEDDFSSEDASLEKGKTMTLTDEQAVHFVRGRMGVGDGENTSRMRRQKTYMEAYYKKAMEKIKETPGWVNDLYRELMDVASTNLKGRDVSQLLNQISSYSSKGIKNIEGKLKLGQALGDGIDHTEFYPDKKSLVQTMKDLYGLQERED